MQNSESPLKLLRLPSLDGENYGLIAALPPGISMDEGISMANQAILEANREDHANEGTCNDGLPVETSIKNRLQANGFTFPEVGVTQCWDEYVEGSPVVTIMAPASEEREQVWKATLSLAGQSVLGEWVGLAHSAHEVRDTVMDLFWDSRLDAGDASPTLHLEKPGEGLSGPFDVLVDGGFYDSVPIMVTAFNLADLLRETTEGQVTVEHNGEELFCLPGLAQT